MKKIVLLCSVGYSTSLLMSKMRDTAKQLNYECEIDAYPMAEAPKVIPDADIVLIGPQVRFEEKRLKNSFSDKVIEVIDSRMYGTMDGEGVMKSVIKKLGQ